MKASDYTTVWITFTAASPELTTFRVADDASRNYTTGTNGAATIGRC